MYTISLRAELEMFFYPNIPTKERIEHLNNDDTRETYLRVDILSPTSQDVSLGLSLTNDQ
jgi:hypothetical protein